MLKGPEAKHHGRKLVIGNTENENESQLARQMKREKWKNKSFLKKTMREEKTLPTKSKVYNNVKLSQGQMRPKGMPQAE